MTHRIEATSSGHCVQAGNARMWLVDGAVTIRQDSLGVAGECAALDADQTDALRELLTKARQAPEEPQLTYDANDGRQYIPEGVNHYTTEEREEREERAKAAHVPDRPMTDAERDWCDYAGDDNLMGDPALGRRLKRAVYQERHPPKRTQEDIKRDIVDAVRCTATALELPALREELIALEAEAK